MKPFIIYIFLSILLQGQLSPIRPVFFYFRPQQEIAGGKGIGGGGHCVGIGQGSGGGCGHGQG